MSHFTSIKTQMVIKEHIKQAVESAGYVCVEGDVEIRGYEGHKTPVELRIATQSQGYDIGFRRTGNVYEMVADWWGIHDIDQKQFLQKITQQYAYHATKAKLEEQGFNLVSEESQADGQIHLRLRRMV